MQRSWILVPADKESALAQAGSVGADAVVIDLARASTEDRKQSTRLAAREWLFSHREQVVAARRFTRWVRIGPIAGSYWREDLDAAMDGAPDGFLLAECGGSDDIQQFASVLYEMEGRVGIRSGATKIVPELGSTANSALHLAGYAEELHPRVAGLTWDAAGLSRSLGARRMRVAGGMWSDPLAYVRAQVLLAACARRIDAIEAPYRDARDADGGRRSFEAARADGFSGMFAIHPLQIEGINAAFSPTQDEIAEAREVVGVFSLNPSAESLPFRGRYIGQAELVAAKLLLGEA